MKLTEMFISRMEGFADEPLCIYQVYTSKGRAGTLVLKGPDRKFVAAFDCIDDAREAILGYPVDDQEGGQWRFEEVSQEAAPEDTLLGKILDFLDKKIEACGSFKDNSEGGALKSVRKYVEQLGKTKNSSSVLSTSR